MAGLGKILGAVQPDAVRGGTELNVELVACHPDDVSGPHCLFVCMDEYLEYNRWQTWRTHLEALPALGLAALVAPEFVEGLDIPQFVTAEPRKALGRLARLLAGYPDLEMPIYGITGTNGKTTTARILGHLLTQLGQPCGSIGTLGVTLNDGFSLPGSYTTPLAPQLYENLNQLRNAGAMAVAMEVSSHALALDRIEGVEFAAGILTNIERDHLDFHGTAEAYAEAKRRLFERVRPDGWCVLNLHSPYCQPFAKISGGQVITYGRKGSGSDLQLLEMELKATHSSFRVEYEGDIWSFDTQLVGEFQIENAMAAISLLAAQGYEGGAIANALREFSPVIGRMERFLMPNGCTAIVDYAHNPDGLKHLLENCRMLCKGKLHVVFGCGGDRDRGKRALMGQVASQLADVLWVTSDNPRTEDPDSIMAEILEGCRGASARLLTEPDRAVAIQGAYAASTEGDILVVAGKGHEDYQIIGYTKHPFSDQGVLKGLGGA